MLHDIISDPLKLTMFVILVVLEVPAAIFLVWAWIKANREAKEHRKERTNDE